MEILDFSTFGGREAIILAMALIGAYLLVSLGRLALLKLRQYRARRPRPPAVAKEPGQEKRRKAATATETPRQVARPAVEELPLNYAEAPAAFDEHLYRSGIDAELQRLRSEVAALREDLAQLKTARPVSPQYSEAMLLAKRGADAQHIADHCAISLGEAELVVALSRDKQEYEDHDGSYDGQE